MYSLCALCLLSLAQFCSGHSESKRPTTTSKQQNTGLIRRTVTTPESNSLRCSIFWSAVAAGDPTGRGGAAQQTNSARPETHTRQFIDWLCRVGPNFGAGKKRLYAATMLGDACTS